MRDVDVWTSSGVERGRDILIVNGFIKRTADNIKVSRKVKVIDGSGRVMIPGLIDSHVHFSFPGDAGDSKGDPILDALTFGRQMLAAGVTSARVHLDTLQHGKLLLDLSKDECAPMPRLQVGGPAFVPGTGNDPNSPVWDATSAADAADKVRREYAQGFRWIAIHDAHQFPDEASAALVNTARQLGMRIFASGYSQDQFASSLKLAPDTLDYLDVSPTSEYDPKLLEQARTQKQLTWVPRIGIHDSYRAYQENPALIDDPLNYEFFAPAIGLALREGVRKTVADRDSERSKAMDAAYPTMARKFEQARQSGVPLAMGTDTGSPAQFQRTAIWWEIDAWMNHGATLDEALTASTGGGSRVLNDPDVGRLTPGAHADFLLCPAELLSERPPLNWRDCRVFKGAVETSRL